MMFSPVDKQWMYQALELAKCAAKAEEVPIGALVVYQGQIIGQGENRPIRDADPSAHAEIIALRQAARHLKNYRLNGAVLYVTLAPCLMCIGAIAHARIKRVVFGAIEQKIDMVTQLRQTHLMEKLNHQTIYQGGLLAEECGGLLSAFFHEKRRLLSEI